MAEYIPLFLDWACSTEGLSDAEKGRLVDAMVAYANGEDTQNLIKGNERFVFNVFRGVIDRHFEKVNADKANGNRGGRPRKTPVIDEKTPVIDEKPNNNNNNNNNDNDNEDKRVTVRAHPVRFTPPSIDELKTYCTDQGYKIDAERFLAYYESNGWRVGRNPMKDWKAAVRTWVRNDATGTKPSKPTPTAMQFEQRDYTGVDFSALNADLSKYK